MFEEEDDCFEDRVEQLEVYQKANEICRLSRIVSELVLKDKIEWTDGYEAEMAKGIAEHILENSTIIPAKIAGAEGGDLYDIRMECAAMVRKCAMEIRVNCNGLKMCKFPDEDYLDLLRSEIEEFRVLFAEWVKTFDSGNYVIDRWGLFNPPNVNFDDHDPDDDLPFDPRDFLD